MTEDTPEQSEQRLANYDKLDAEYAVLNERVHQIMLRASGLAVVTATAILSFGELFTKAPDAAKVLSISVLVCGLSGCFAGVAAYVSLH